MDKKPNLVFFFTDQQRWDSCGCYGQKLPTTPNLDAMAADGVLFENAFTCQPVCGPARACLQTGKYATETGCFRNDIGLPLDEKTIAHHFSENGWKTGYIGKWHLASNYSSFSGTPPPEGQSSRNYRAEPVPLALRGGWKDEWIAADVLEFTSHSYDGHVFDKEGRRREFPEGRFRSDAITDWAVETLDKWGKEKTPFFLFLSYIEPHHQNDHKHYEGPHGSAERFGSYVPPADLAGREGDWQAEYPDYLGCVNALDENLGRVRRKLQELGIADDTILIFASDHGSHFRTRNRSLRGGYDDYKRSFHEGASHVPLVACGPGFKGGKRLESMVSLIDLPATFLDSAGIPVPGTFRGKPLGPLAAGTEADGREDVFIQISESMVGRALRTRRWAYLAEATDLDGWNHAGSDVYAETALYDLEADPTEWRNLVADPETRVIRAELRERLAARMAAAGEKRPRILPA